MTDPNRPTPTPNGDSPEPEAHKPAVPQDPTAGRAGMATGVESAGGTAAPDPDALDQSVGRGDAGQGDARTRDGAI